MNSTATAHVLIIEDDTDTFDWMRRRLESYGFQTDWARTLAEARAVLQEAGNDLCCLILDLKLPDGSGGEILRHIRENALPIKVAVVTGAQSNETLSDAILLKPDAFFRKPVDFIEVVAWLKSACTMQ